MRRVKQITAVLLVLVLACAAVGCKKKKMSDEQYLELAEKKAEQNKKTTLLVMTAGDGSVYNITAYDMVYYLAYNEKAALEFKAKQNDYYSTMYGADYDFWSVTDSNGTTVKDGYKEQAYAAAAYAFVFAQEAKNAGMTIEESRRVSLNTATEQFLAGFTAEQKARCGMTEACIRENYERIFLAEQYIEKMTADYKVDEAAIRASIDKEDYRVYKTNYMYVSKFDREENSFKQIELSPEEAAKRKAAIEDALVRAESGESLEQICTLYNEFMYGGTSSFTKQQINEDPDYNNAALKLKKGECTLFERESSYYVIILVDNEEFSGYEEAVEAAIEDERNKGVAALYQSISGAYDFAKTEAWEAITLGSYTITP
ncbi:MAG: hypothetical protein J6S79_05860 [Lachnospiraceae bacterium]|nr:hypothetical protein [Lachnospiraceae bacterium]